MFILSLIAKLHQNPRTRRVLWRQIYQSWMGSYHGRDWTFSNYGYGSLNGMGATLPLDAGEESDRYCIQMYHHVASAVDLKGLRVIEVGSGRGGGSSYLKRRLQPRALVGVDLSENAVKFCTACHRIDGLFFIAGDAESLPFRDRSFDIVVNVESSHCYPSMPAFVGEVTRILRPGGYFLFADFRPRLMLEKLREDLEWHGLTVLNETDITANVMKALDADNARKLHWIRRSAPRVLGFKLTKLMQEFWGIEGSRMNTAFRSGGMRYLFFVLQKHMTSTAA